MKATNTNKFSAKVITLAVQSAMIAMFVAPLAARADDTPSAEVTALTKPTNSVNVGAEYVPISSAKFGEYNGLDQRGTYMIGNFDMRGGDAYNAANGGDGTKRVEIKGNDLGTTSRDMSLDISDQGKWSFGFGYDELRHNITNTYQTPFLGAMGGNNFTLPSNFGIIDTKDTRPLGGATTLYTAAPGANVLTPAQIADFNTTDVYSQRENSKFNAGFVFNSQWNMKFDYNHLQQSGAKLQGVGGDQSTGNPVGGGVGGIAGGIFAGQTPMVIMTPTNYTTDTFNFALNWAGDKSYATASYYGSMFRDAYSEVNFNNPFFTQTTANAINTGNTTLVLPQDAISTMPGNDFNQVNVNGGFNFTPTTKLVGGVSYARNSQHDAYSTSVGQLSMTPSGYPQSSLNGLVATTHADMKLTDQSTKDLQLSASVKYDKRDNQTASNGYNFYTMQQTPVSPFVGTSAVNTPMSNSKTQFNLAGDYRIDKSQKLNLAYDYEAIQRSCNGVTYPQSNPVTTAGNAYNYGLQPYTASTCAEVPASKENKFTATYKVKASESLNLNAGLGYADRVAEVNQLFYNPMQVNGTTAAASNNEGFEVPGFMSYMDASRREEILKVGANWQASEKLSISANGRYTFDRFDESTYGVQNGRSYSFNLDATYAENEYRMFSVYATTQNKSRDMTNLLQGSSTTATAPTTAKLNIPAGSQTWTNNLTENDLTLGVGAKQGGLMANKLELSGDLTYSLDKTSYSTVFNYAAQDSNGNTCSSVYYLTCGSTPDIKSDMLQLKLAGVYKVDKDSKVRVGYMFQRLNATDYLYNAYQYGSTPTSLLPTNQQAPSYSVNVVSVSYTITY